ncbi:MAG: DUF5916 domain-containing protein [Candidatus Krumholzibacteriaceae bacterium]
MRRDQSHRWPIWGCSVALITLLATGSAIRADDAYAPVYHPEIKVTRAAGPIKIDGDLNDPGWRGAAKASNFAEYRPGNQTKPAVNTEAYITYDDENLYVAFKCYDNPKDIRATFCERDKIWNDDVVFLCLDPYGEATRGYEIAVNPYGIQGDILFATTTGEDATYDMIYTTASKIVDDGWVAEMAIPFSSLRFPDKSEQPWKINFWRNRPRESNYAYSWAAYNRDENCWACQWGTVTGITGIKPSKGFDLLPSVVAHESGSLGDNGRLENGDVKGDFGIGASYDISSELKAEATVNPDFSQVESDVAQIDVNSTFALFYPEKRPFFQEGNDLFNTTYFTAVYTRSINDPQVAGKGTWRSGPNSLAFLTGRDDHSVIILPFEERSEFVENGKSYSNLLRYKRDLGNASMLGLVATDRRFDDGGSGSLAGVDGQLRLSASNSFRFQALASHTEEVNNLALVPDSAFNATRFDDGKYTAGLDGERYWGRALYACLDRSLDSYELTASYGEESPTFRADNGFEPANDQRVGAYNAYFTKRFEKSPFFEYLQMGTNGAMKWNFDGVKKDEYAYLSAILQTRAAQTMLHMQYMASNELFHAIQFNGIWAAHVCFNTQPSGRLILSGNFNYGHRIARYDLVMGKEIDYGLSADIKPIDRLLFSTSLSRSQSDGLESGERLFSQSVFWSRLSLQISRELSMRFIGQYNDRYRTWDVDPLITYRINSLTMFYVGSTHTYEDFDQAESGPRGWTLADRQFFMKLQYLFQI